MGVFWHPAAFNAPQMREDALRERGRSEPLQRNTTPAVWDVTGHPERRRISENPFPLLFTSATFFGSVSTKCDKLSADLADLERFTNKINAISF